MSSSNSWAEFAAVLGNNGRQVEICQRTVEIDAPSELVATELAKQKFCKAERLCEWSLRADRIQIKPPQLSILDYPNLRLLRRPVELAGFKPEEVSAVTLIIPAFCLDVQ
jgi:hypothetical protein